MVLHKARRMEMAEILEALNYIFQEIVDDPNVELKRETTAQDVDDWDSLNHITFIVAIEKHFKVKFSSAEIRSWKNVGEMCDAIAHLV
jgi:acyl carrier protein